MNALRTATLLGLLAVGVEAKIHYARVQPIEKSTLKSAVAGRIVYADRVREGQTIRNMQIVVIDDAIDRIDLNASRESLRLLEENLELSRSSLDGLKGNFQRARDSWRRTRTLQSASKAQKDQAYAAMIAAQNQYLATRQQILTLRRQLVDLRKRIATLKDRIAKKHVRLNNRYLYKLLVHRGEYAAPGTPLAVVENLSRAKLTIYLDPEELEGIESKSVWINGRKSDVKITKIWKVSDEKYLSSYRAEIVIPPTHRFSSLVKVELK